MPSESHTATRRAPEPHWTDGPARWIAAVVLGAACLAGLGWSIFGRAAHAHRAPLIAPTTHQPAAVDSPAPGTAPQTPARETYAQRININTAGEAELQLLPGIGPALSARIIEDRQANGPFKSVDDLMRIKGIGPRTVARLRDMARAE